MVGNSPDLAHALDELIIFKHLLEGCFFGRGKTVLGLVQITISSPNQAGIGVLNI